jgi:hypothetical protein
MSTRNVVLSSVAIVISIVAIGLAISVMVNNSSDNSSSDNFDNFKPDEKIITSKITTQSFTLPGEQAYTLPKDCKMVQVELIGGGGGSGGFRALPTTSDIGLGGAGGGGGYVKFLVKAELLGSKELVLNIGAGGIPGKSSADVPDSEINGQNGQATELPKFGIAFGGSGGQGTATDIDFITLQRNGGVGGNGEITIYDDGLTLYPIIPGADAGTTFGFKDNPNATSFISLAPGGNSFYGFGGKSETSMASQGSVLVLLGRNGQMFGGGASGPGGTGVPNGRNTGSAGASGAAFFTEYY